MEENNMAIKIKQLRLANKMTLEDVASKVGVGKSTVRKWETGMIANMKRDKILSLAKALGTTPEYLMGWEKTEVEPNKMIDLNDDEKVLIDLYRSVPENKRKMIVDMIKIAIN